MNKRFRSVLVFCTLSLAVLLTGCNSESKQQIAFINFLQKDVIPRNSGFLIPNADTRKKFGVYAAHYSLIVEYNKILLERVSKPLEKLQREYQDAVKPETSAEERKEAIIEYREALQAIKKILDKEFASVESKIEALSQPDEVKGVYARAVEKHVHIPGQDLRDLIVSIEMMLNKNLDLLDYIIANKGKVELKEGMIEVDRNKKDYQSTLDRLYKMQSEIREMADIIQAQHTEKLRQLINK